MKIQKFNERMSDAIEEYLDDFNGYVDYSILDWIELVSTEHIKFKEYKNINYENPDSIKYLPKIINTKNFKNYKNLLLILDEIKQLEQKIEKLEKKKEKIKKDVDNEVMYKFQSELLYNDIDGFYLLFLKNEIEDSIKNDYDFNIFNDIHPNIYTNIKYKNIINNIPQVKEWLLKKDSNKYNL